MITNFKIFESKNEEKVIYLGELRKKHMTYDGEWQIFDIESIFEELKEDVCRGSIIKLEIFENGSWINKMDILKERDPGRYFETDYMELGRIEIVDNRILIVIKLPVSFGESNIVFDIAKRFERDGIFNNNRHVDNKRIILKKPKIITSMEDPYGEENWDD
jgi:hypothetical protein